MGDEGGGRGCGPARELRRLKQQALEYYRENDVPRRLEELLNSTFYLQPADVYGHLVGTWDSTRSPPAPPPRPALRQRCAPAPRGRARASLPRAGRPRWCGKAILQGSSRAGNQGRRRFQKESGGWEAAGGWWAPGGFVATATARGLPGFLAASGPAGPGCRLFL